MITPDGSSEVVSKSFRADFPNSPPPLFEAAGSISDTKATEDSMANIQYGLRKDTLS